MSSILLKCIQTFMGDRVYTIYKKEDMTTMEFTNDNGIDLTMVLTSTISFKEFKKNFNRYNKLEDLVCLVCYEEMRGSFGCFNCKNTICLRCYIRLLDHNRGITKCPVCRFEDGEEIQDDKELNDFLDKKVAELKRQIKLYIASTK